MDNSGGVYEIGTFFFFFFGGTGGRGKNVTFGVRQT
jgi:hypothetical protein